MPWTSTIPIRFSCSSPPLGGEAGGGGYRQSSKPPHLTSPPNGGEEHEGGGRWSLSPLLLRRLADQRRVLGKHLADVLALAGDGLGHGVVERLVHRRPLREVIGAAHLVRRLERGFLQQLHEGI